MSNHRVDNHDIDFLWAVDCRARYASKRASDIAISAVVRLFSTRESYPRARGHVQSRAVLADIDVAHLAITFGCLLGPLYNTRERPRRLRQLLVRDGAGLQIASGFDGGSGHAARARDLTIASSIVALGRAFEGHYGDLRAGCGVTGYARAGQNSVIARDALPSAPRSAAAIEQGNALAVGKQGRGVAVRDIARGVAIDGSVFLHIVEDVRRIVVHEDEPGWRTSIDRIVRRGARRPRRGRERRRTADEAVLGDEGAVGMIVVVEIAADLRPAAIGAAVTETLVLPRRNGYGWDEPTVSIAVEDIVENHVVRGELMANGAFLAAVAVDEYSAVVQRVK